MLSSGVFSTWLKFAGVNPYLKNEIKMLHPTIDLFLYLH
jgi:hypothetical protein